MFPDLKGMKCQSSTSLLGLEGFIQGRQGFGAEGEATVTENIKALYGGISRCRGL